MRCVLNYKWTFKRIIFSYFKKHLCPNCKERLKVIWINRVINKKSPDARNHDFSSFNSYFFGDVKFFWNEFKCKKCGKIISAEDLYNIEKENNDQYNRDELY